MNRKVSQIIVVLLLSCLVACASSRRSVVYHAFSFDAVHDSPNIEVLKHRYGNSKNPGARSRSFEPGFPEEVEGGTGVTGAMLVGDFLYVKWRIKGTTDVFEDTVDLRRRLPANMDGNEIRFVVKDRQLYVYLISSEAAPPGWPTNGPPGYEDKKTYQIYPGYPDFS
jgi:hypothetical protein